MIGNQESDINSLLKKARVWCLNNWQDLFIWIWTVLVLSADLKVNVYSHIHWIVTLLLLVPVIIAVSKRIPSINENWIVILPSLLLVSAVIISSFNSVRPLYGFVQSGKLFVILIFVLLFFVVWPKFAKISFKGFIAAAYINGLLIILGIFLLPGLAHEMSAGRWGTFLNFPGSLGKTGVLILIYATYMALMSKTSMVKHNLLLCLSILIVYFDGTRTGLIALAGGLMIIFVIIIMECAKEGRLNFLLYRIFYSLMTLAIFWTVVLYPIQITKYTPIGFSRINAVHSNITPERLEENENNITNSNSLLEKLAQKDPARFKMLSDGITAIAAHPFWGTGIGSTKSTTMYGTMVIHNTYLQVWADLGILGMVAFTLLVFGWIAFLPRVYLSIKGMSKPESRAIYYNVIFMLGYFAFNGFFHPLSTEWSEWITFIIPFALYWELTRKSTDIKREVN